MSTNANPGALRYAEVLWNYHRLSSTIPESADLLLVGGSHDLRVADRASELIHRGNYKWIVVSGGAGKITKDSFSESEAEIFIRRMVELGVERSRLIAEPNARHTGENVAFAKSLLDEEGRNVQTGLLVTKPYMERRFLATATKQWPAVEWSVTSPTIEFQDYPSQDVPEQRMIELMVGDLQRIKLYAERGIQSPQDVPEKVWEAYRALISEGYDAQLIKEV